MECNNYKLIIWITHQSYHFYFTRSGVQYVDCATFASSPDLKITININNVKILSPNRKDDKRFLFFPFLQGMFTCHDMAGCTKSRQFKIEICVTITFLRGKQSLLHWPSKRAATVTA